MTGLLQLMAPLRRVVLSSKQTREGVTVFRSAAILPQRRTTWCLDITFSTPLCLRHPLKRLNAGRHARCRGARLQHESSHEGREDEEVQQVEARLVRGARGDRDDGAGRARLFRRDGRGGRLRRLPGLLGLLRSGSRRACEVISMVGREKNEGSAYSAWAAAKVPPGSGPGRTAQAQAQTGTAAPEAVRAGWEQVGWEPVDWELVGRETLATTAAQPEAPGEPAAVPSTRSLSHRRSMGWWRPASRTW